MYFNFVNNDLTCVNSTLIIGLINRFPMNILSPTKLKRQTDNEKNIIIKNLT